ncbi:MAG TPA: ChbG/HpnK family deacetylase [Terriglobales bacterium]
MRRLIVNADDFGLTSGVNRAIREAGSSGAITSASMMANASEFAEAATIAQSLPGLKTGCHVVLVDGQSLESNLSSLSHSDRRFRTSLKDFARAAMGKRLLPDEIERETKAQIRKIQAQGITVSHLDSHKHTHMFPQVLRPVLRAARSCGVRAVRNPFEPIGAWPIGFVAARPGVWLRSVGVFTFRLFAGEFRKAILEADMLTTDGTVGIAITGKLDQKSLLALLDALPEGTWELVCHPGYVDDDLRATGTRLVGSREIELEALSSPVTKDRLKSRGIELISYADLKES